MATAETETTRCDHCGATIRYQKSLNGKTVNCPKCSKKTGLGVEATAFVSEVDARVKVGNNDILPIASGLSFFAYAIAVLGVISAVICVLMTQIEVSILCLLALPVCYAMLGFGKLLRCMRSIEYNTRQQNALLYELLNRPR